ncbi:MAG: class I SAM-dependent methyltransferase [Desulfotomaculum sp.]|nr:class I SAM-dependent methyltransferase [Desulfotomaculum sp.]
MRNQPVLTKRLLALVDYIESGQIIADIGTDHAYLPIFLVHSGRCPLVIASDVKSSPIEVARKNINKSGLGAKIELRLGCGLQVLRPAEVQVAIIAGMGGNTIKQILKQTPEVLVTLKRLVLQPMNDQAHLRYWLITNGWCLVDETLVSEDEHLYNVIVAQPGREPVYDSLILEIGPKLIKKKHRLLPELLTKLKHKYQLVLAGVSKSNKPAAKIKLEQVKKHLRQLEELIQQCR